ncbi:MAG: hypothetical protein ACYS8W_11525 [Planctomycetota bacterium]|jgi:hypothetical protein
MAYAVWIVLFFLLSFALGMLYGPITRTQACRLIFLPGFLAVAIIKAIGCGVTGTKVKEFAPFGDDTDLCGYDIRKAKWWRATIINLVTLVGTLALIIVIAYACEARIGHKGKFPASSGSFAHMVRDTGHYVVDSFVNTTWLMWGAIKAIFSGDFAVLLYLYLVIGLLIAMPVPPEEFKYGLIGTLALGLIVFGLSYLVTAKPGFRNTSLGVLSFAMAMTLSLLGVSLVGVGGLRIFGLVKQKPPHRDDDD